MTFSALPEGQRGYGRSAEKHTCPLCAAYLMRVPRRGIDRLLSLFVRVYRYRCPIVSCQWEGNLRVRSRADPEMTISPR